MNANSLHWIHCNRCFDIYTRKHCAFYVLACHHIVCDRCSQVKLGDAPSAVPTYKCCMCKKDVRGRQIGNNMPQHIKELFHPQPYMDDLPISRILNFQMKHRQHLAMGTMRIARNKLKIQQNFQLARDSAQKKFETLENMKRERRRLDQRVRQIIAKRKEREAKRNEQHHARSLDHMTTLLPQRPRYASSTANPYNLAITQPPSTSHLYGPRLPNPFEQRPACKVNSFTYKRNQSFNL